MCDLVVKIVGITGAEHEHRKLVPTDTKTWFQSGYNKVVMTT